MLTANWLNYLFWEYQNYFLNLYKYIIRMKIIFPTEENRTLKVVNLHWIGIFIIQVILAFHPPGNRALTEFAPA